MITTRDESAKDADAIRRVHREAFPSALESQLVDALRASGRATISLVAERDGVVVAHILFSPVTVGERPPELTRALGLAPVAVSPAFQSKGVGSALIKSGLDVARHAGYRFVVVLGEPGYYARFGFQKASTAGLANEYGVDDPFMVLELTPGALEAISGLVKYAPEFGVFG
jgi:putative acetyltransferase